MSVTIKEMAKQLKLSQAAVCMALRGSPEISRETRKRVRDLAMQLKYIPNHFGRGLKKNRSQIVGYMLGSATRSFSGELLETVGYCLMRNGYGMMTGWVPDSSEIFSSQLKLMMEKNVDGFLFTLTDTLVYEHLDLLRDNGKPVVFCSGYSRSDCNCIVGDQFSGGRILIEHLLEMGHRQIAVAPCPCLRQRHDGYEAALHGTIDAKLIDYQSVDDLPGMLSAHPEITAIPAYSDEEAINIAELLRQQGYDIPGRISLVGFDDLWFAGRREFQLTTVAQPRRQIAERSYARLKELIDGDKSIRQEILPVELIVRNSVRRIR